MSPREFGRPGHSSDRRYRSFTAPSHGRAKVCEKKQKIRLDTVVEADLWSLKSYVTGEVRTVAPVSSATWAMGMPRLAVPPY